MSDAPMPTTRSTPAPGAIVAALKWADLFFDVDPFSGEATADAKARGFSAADEAALELALGLGEALDRSVVAISVGGDDAVAGLERALAVGVDRAVLVSLDGSDRDSLSVAAALAWALESAGLTDPLVVCGDYSADRGSGTVPAALAALTGLPQALGLVSASLVDPVNSTDAPSARAASAEGTPLPARIRVQRRLDGARREELLVSPPAVVSVEGAVARLRRAPLGGTLGAGRTKIERLVAPGDLVVVPSAGVGEVGPPTPRTKVMAPPDGGDALARVEQLTGMASTATAPAQALVVSPEEAARHLLDAWVASGGTVPDDYDAGGADPGPGTGAVDRADRPVIGDPDVNRPAATAPAAPRDA